MIFDKELWRRFSCLNQHKYDSCKKNHRERVCKKDIVLEKRARLVANRGNIGIRNMFEKIDITVSS